MLLKFKKLISTLKHIFIQFMVLSFTKQPTLDTEQNPKLLMKQKYFCRSAFFLKIFDIGMDV